MLNNACRILAIRQSSFKILQSSFFIMAVAFNFFMKQWMIAGLLLLANVLGAQELYVFTEPASNMSARSIGLRLDSKLMPMQQDTALRLRNSIELMLGLSKKLMLHASVSASDAFTRTYRPEAASLYAKYRFFSQDEVHRHLRMAAFARLSLSNNPPVYETSYKYFIDHGSGPEEHTQIKGHVVGDIDLGGNNSGWETGFVITQLKHRLAVSSSVSYVKLMPNAGYRLLAQQPRFGFNYTASAGYLLLPREYVSYRQTNVNLYAELLGTVLGQGKGHYADIAPAVQFIFNSIARLDIGARINVWNKNNVHRMGRQSYLLRLEYNFLNALKKKRK
jgi:hypothetical protein